jgi:peptidoglycan/LPS O-acetylase OafA/YrhL
MTRKHLPALDGIRGVAILLVMSSHLAERFRFFHLVPRAIKRAIFAGWSGVDLFFVLSGFLITGALLDSKGLHGFFRNFYARRTLRIFPLYYATLVICFVLIPLIYPGVYHHVGYRTAFGYWPWFFTYMVDVLVAWKGFVFVGGHFWTLAVEEHFYLAWPFLVKKLNDRKLVGVCVAFILIAEVSRLAIAIHGTYAVAPYALTLCRLDGLSLGALLAIIVRRPTGVERLAQIARVTFPAALVAYAVVLYWRPGQYGVFQQTVGYTVTETLYASGLVLALAYKNVASMLSVSTLRFFGKISYALYIFHPFIFLQTGHFLGLGRYESDFTSSSAGRLLIFSIISVGGSIAAAVISWHVLEYPCLRLKRLFSYEDVASKRTESAIVSQPVRH